MALLRQGKSEKELQLQAKWFEVRRFVKEKFKKRPDINAILFLIGMNEVGIVKETWEKEEKQDLMHVAICTLFIKEGYYKLKSIDQEGWPHYEKQKDLPNMLLKEQENTLKAKIIDYFEEKAYISTQKD